MIKGNRQLLVETFTLNMPTKQNITQSIKNNNGRLLLTGRLQFANKPNGNLRIYPKSILQRQINKYQHKIKINASLGQCDHPDSDSISLKNVAILIKQVHWQGDEVIGTIQLLSNSIGRDMQALVEDGVTLSISSRGMGSLVHKDGYDYVEQDFQLTGWDLVVQPSTQGASFYNRGLNRESIQTKIQKLVQTKPAVKQKETILSQLTSELLALLRANN